MIFKLEYNPPLGNDIVSMTVCFHAPGGWIAAETWANTFLKHIGASWTGAVLTRV